MDKISIVTSLYLSAPYVRDFHARHLACLRKMGVEYEFVFVDDGSPDDAQAVVRELIAANDNVKLVCLSRNFGQHAAMFAGLAHAAGDYVCALDCDLEEAPENILGMFDVVRRDRDIDVVYGVLRKRPGGVVRNFLATAFYRVLDYLSTVKVPRNQAWQRVMSRRYVRELLRFDECESLPAGLMVLAGFRQEPYPIDKTFKGNTSYSLRKRLVLAVNSITSFSSRPLEVIGLFGIAVTFTSFVAIAVMIALVLSGHDYQVGWPSVIASIWCVGGLILSSVGLVGIYLAKVFNQVKNRPRYVVRRIIESRTRAEGVGDGGAPQCSTTPSA